MEKFLNRGIKGGLYLALLTPIFFAQTFIYPFITPKIFVFQTIVELIFGLWLTLVILYPNYRPKLTWLTWALVAFLGVLIVSSIFGIDSQRSFWSTQDRSLGLVSLLHFGVFFLILTSFKNKFEWRRYLTFSFWVSVFISIFAIVQLYTPWFFLESSVGRPGSFLGNPAFLASYLIPHIFFGFWLASEAWRRAREKSYHLASWVLTLGVLINLFTLLLTKTRGAILGLALGLLVLLIYSALKRSEEGYYGFSTKASRKIALVLGAVFLVGGCSFWFTRSADFWKEVPILNRFSNLSANSLDVQPRLITWRIAWQSFLDRPILGFGFENFKYPFDKYYEPELLRHGFSETYFDKPHNVFLEYLAVAGLLGFLAYLFLVSASVKGLLSFSKLKSFTPWGLGLVAAYLVQNFFVFDTFGAYLALFMVLAFIDAHDPKQESMSSRPTPIWSPKLKWFLTGSLVLIALIPVYFVNAKILYANNRRFWGRNYFVNRLVEEGLNSYLKALETKEPYRDATRKDFASDLSQIYKQGLEIPEVKEISRAAMFGLATTINNKPNDFFLRYTFADLSTIFYVFDEEYLKIANDQIEEALKLSPKRQGIYYIGAKVKLIEGKKSEALELIKKAVDLDPQVGDPHLYYGFIAFEAGETELGFKEIEEAKRLGREPNTYEEMRVIGNYYGDAGRYREAIGWYKNALRLNPDDIESKLKLGLVYYLSGDLNQARPVLEEVAGQLDLTQSPAFPSLKVIYDDLGLDIQGKKD